MDMEEIENTLEEVKTLQRFGFMNREHYVAQKEMIVKGLIIYGDTFGYHLGHTLGAATIENSLKIMRYWSQLCEQHALLWKIQVAKEKANLSGQL